MSQTIDAISLEAKKVSADDINEFIRKKFIRPEQKKLKEMEASLVTEGPMSKDCRLVFNIPCFFGEKGLQKTLLTFLNQHASTEGPDFEVIVLVNGPDGSNIENSAAYKDALAIQNRFPELKLTIAKTTYPKEELRIGRIRKDLAAITLKRASQTSGVDIGNLIIVTQDADLIDMDEHYVENVVREFDQQPDLSALTGFIDHPREDFYSDHLFLTVQRFTDIIEIINRYRHNNFPLRGGNSAFRVSHYLQAGGHSRSRLWEHMNLSRSFREENPDSVKFIGKRAKITTSARRQIVAIEKGVKLIDRYKTFGIEGDLAEDYQKPVEETVLPEMTHKVTSPQFKDLLQEELQSIYDSKIKIEEKSLQGDDPRIEKNMKTAARFMGIRIHFEERKVFVDDISQLREDIMKKYSNF